MDYQSELTSIEEKANNAKLEQARLLERKRNTEAEISKILEELKKEQIEEDKLETLILDLEVEIEQEINKCQQILA